MSDPLVTVPISLVRCGYCEDSVAECTAPDMTAPMCGSCCDHAGTEANACVLLLPSPDRLVNPLEGTAGGAGGVVTAEQLELAVQFAAEEVGYGSGAWDMIEPTELAAAFARAFGLTVAP